MKKLLILIIGCIILWSCGKKDDPTPSSNSDKVSVTIRVRQFDAQVNGTLAKFEYGVSGMSVPYSLKITWEENLFDSLRSDSSEGKLLILKAKDKKELNPKVQLWGWDATSSKIFNGEVVKYEIQ